MNPAIQDHLTFSCSSCGITLQVSLELAGQSGPCPSCGKTITAPQPQPAPQQAASPFPSPAAPVAPASPPLQQQQPAPIPQPPQESRPEPIPTPAAAPNPVPAPAPVPTPEPAPVNPAPVPTPSTVGGLVGNSSPAGLPPLHPSPPASAPPEEAGLPPQQAGLPPMPMPGQNPAPEPEAVGPLPTTAEPEPASAPLPEYGQVKTAGRSSSPLGWIALAAAIVGLMGYLVWSRDLLGLKAPEIQAGDTSPLEGLGYQPEEMEPVETPMATEISAEPVPESAPPVEAPADPEPVSDPIQDDRPTELANADPPSEAENAPESEPLRPVSGGNEPVKASPVDEKVSLLKANQNAILEPARRTIRGFLEGENWEARLPYIYQGGNIRAEVEDYYTNHVDLPFLDYRLDYFHTEPQPGGRKVYVFFLTFSNQQDGFPVIVVEENQTLGMDWDLFVEFKDRHFQKFVEERDQTSRAFRVVIQRVTYWESDRDQIPNVENLICYKIDPPYPGFTRYAFVAKDSDAGQKMVEQLSWQEDPLAGEVQLRWDEFENGRPYLTVDQLVSRSWVRK